MSSKLVKKIAALCIISLLSSSSFADKANDYDADYLTDEGRLLFKLRAYGLFTNGKQSGLPAATVKSPSSVSNFAKNGFGADTSTTIFFSDSIGVEASLGLHMMRVTGNGLNSVSSNYGGSGGAKGKPIYGIPLTGSLQYHIAPFGGIRPYVGGGYHYVYFFKKVSQVKIDNGHGPLLQAGIDFVAKDDTIITFDVRQYFLRTKVKYDSNFVGGKTGVSSKVKFNPLLVSLGIGFKF